MLQNFLSLTVWFAFFLLVEKLGEQSLAISNIIRSVYIVLMIPIWGFASAANSMVSYLIGLRRQDQIFVLIKRILFMATGGVLLIVLISLISPQAIISIYTNDAELIQKTIPVLFVINFSAIALSFGFVLFNSVLGTGKTNISFFIEMIVLSIYILYVYLLVHFFDVSVVEVWTAELVYGVMMSTLSYLYLRKGKWSEIGI